MQELQTGMRREEGSGGTHTSRTILLSELRGLLASVPASAGTDDYKSAVIDDNVLGKRTLNSRQRTYRYLRELYALDTSVLLYRALRDLWDADFEAQPLLAMLSALARDPGLRATAPAVLPLPVGEAVTADDLAEAVLLRFPGAYSVAIANKIGRNAASSWTQSGHLAGHTGKTRSRALARPAAVAYALLLGHLDGSVGEGLFATLWTQALDAPADVLHQMAFAASQRGWVEFRHGGGVTDVGFSFLLRKPMV